MPKLHLAAILTFFVFASGVCYGQEGPSRKTSDIVLTPADQLILQAISKVNDRIDNVNDRIDNLWITMLGGFLGVMAFIGALVFWDRRTFLSRAREGLRAEMAENRNKINGLLAATKMLGEQFPQVRDALRSFGLL